VCGSGLLAAKGLVRDHEVAPTNESSQPCGCSGPLIPDTPIGGYICRERGV